MTAYEIEREERIKRNNAVMGKLPTNGQMLL